MISPQSFQFDGWRTNNLNGTVSLQYSCSDDLCFTETINFGGPLPETGALRRVFEAALDGLSIAAGVSYYKAFAPESIIIAEGLYSDAQLRFFQNLFIKGLGEFGFRNQIKLIDRIDILGAKLLNRHNPSRVSLNVGCNENRDTLAQSTKVQRVLPQSTIVMMGAGKDSLTSIEVLRSAGEQFRLMTINPKTPHVACASKSGYDLLTITRTLDPKLFELNEKGAMNGHVPITAILSFIAAAATCVYGFDTIVMSNERSSDEGNIEEDGQWLNHQFSKTLEYETQFQHYLNEFVSPDASYFSLLRPLSEAHIAQLFSRTDRYDKCFTSCNRAFRINADKTEAGWCCDCAKCRFAFLILATAFKRERLTRIFGNDLLEDEVQLQGFTELVGLSNHKPWDCVGEIAESSAAVLQLSITGEWKDAFVVKALAKQLRAVRAERVAGWNNYLQPDYSRMPKGLYGEALSAYIGSE